jgi:hypothetical protein
MQPQQAPGQGNGKQKKQTPEAVIKNGISQTSQLSMHIQTLLDETFALAPNQLKGYLIRADAEVRDLLRLLTSKIGVTPDPDVLDVDYFNEDKEVEIAPPGSVNNAPHTAPVTASASALPDMRRSHANTALALSLASLIEDVTEIAASDSAFEADVDALAESATKIKKLKPRKKVT